MVIGTFQHGFKLLFSSRAAHLLFKIACRIFPFDVWSIGHKKCQYYHVFDTHVLNWLCCYVMQYVVGKIEVIISTWSKNHNELMIYSMIIILKSFLPNYSSENVFRFLVLYKNN